MTDWGTEGAITPGPSARPSPSWSWTGTATCAGTRNSDGARSVTCPQDPRCPTAWGSDRRATAFAPSRAQAGICTARTAPPWSTAGSWEYAPTAPSRTTSRSSSTVGTVAMSGPSTGRRTDSSLGTWASPSSPSGPWPASAGTSNSPAISRKWDQRAAQAGT
eukprot:4584724-Heterocapsa_arctica.AAC.1